MGLFSSIGTSIAGGVIGAFTDPITKIADTIGRTKVELAKEANSEKRIAMEERVKALEARRDILIAESAAGVRLNAFVRALFALVFLVYLIKVVVFDITFGQWTGWSTPPLPDKLDYIMGAVITFYFAYQIVDRLKR